MFHFNNITRHLGCWKVMRIWVGAEGSMGTFDCMHRLQTNSILSHKIILGVGGGERRCGDADFLLKIFPPVRLGHKFLQQFLPFYEKFPRA